MVLISNIISEGKYHLGLAQTGLNSELVLIPSVLTLKCLSIGTPETINFPFVTNGKLMVFRCTNIQSHYNKAVLCLNFGTPEK